MSASATMPYAPYDMRRQSFAARREAAFRPLTTLPSFSREIEYEPPRQCSGGEKYVHQIDMELRFIERRRVIELRAMPLPGWFCRDV